MINLHQKNLIGLDSRAVFTTLANASVFVPGKPFPPSAMSRRHDNQHKDTQYYDITTLSKTALYYYAECHYDEYYLFSC